MHRVYSNRFPLPITKKQGLHINPVKAMNIANTPAVQAASAASQAPSADALNVLVLKKALDIQAASAMSLLQALPQPALASQGTLGTQVNTFA